jgi:hypothetical protein
MPSTDLLAVALARADLSPRTRAFLLDVQRQAARRPLTKRQMRAVARIATTAPGADFATGDRGGDPVSIAAAVARLPQTEAARRLARRLGMGGCGNG